MFDKTFVHTGQNGRFVLVACSYLRQGMVTKRSTHAFKRVIVTVNDMTGGMSYHSASYQNVGKQLSILASVNESLVMSVPSHLDLFKHIVVFYKNTRLSKARWYLNVTRPKCITH